MKIYALEFIKQNLSPFIFIYILVAFAIWAIFYPGLMSVDSLVFYKQAVTGHFQDLHPPLLPITLSGILATGFGIGTLMLIQCLAGCLGLRFFSISIQKAFFVDQLSSFEMELIALIVFGILLSPFSPLIFYLMTFWKDSWLAIFLIWIFAISLNFYVTCSNLQSLRFYPRFFWLALVIALAALTRYNGIVIFVTLCAALLMIIHRRGARWAIFLALSPLVFYLILNHVQYNYFNVKRKHPEKHVMALDLVGLCVESQNICDDLPHTKRHLREDYRYRYISGRMGPLLEEGIVDRDYFREENRYTIVKEYRRAVKTFPLTLAKVKIDAFVYLLGIKEKFELFQSRIPRNRLGLTLNHQFHNIRNILIGVGIKISNHKYLRWVSGVPLVWIVINIVWVVGVIIFYNKRRNRLYLFSSILLSTTIIYYCSYLFATLDHKYRYTYPSTLIIQIITATTVLAFLYSKLRRPKRIKE